MVLSTDKYDASGYEKYLGELLDFLVDKAFDICVALICLFIGIRVTKLILKVVNKSFIRSNLEGSVASFLLSLFKGILYAIVVIMAASIMGFQVTSLVTILGTASLAIGLALQGSLANFAGGVLILLMKPFKVGDYIIENDKHCEGTVVSIDIFYTKLQTIDNRIIVIPNGNITANSIVNITSEKYRRLDMFIGVSYDTDIDKAKALLYMLVKASAYYVSDMDSKVYLDSFGESEIKMGIRFYVPTDKYWDAKWDMNEKIKEAFDREHIVIPFRQIDVNMKENTKENDKENLQTGQ